MGKVFSKAKKYISLRNEKILEKKCTELKKENDTLKQDNSRLKRENILLSTKITNLSKYLYW